MTSISKLISGSSANESGRNSPGIITSGIREPTPAPMANSISVQTQAGWPLSNGNNSRLVSSSPHGLTEYTPRGITVRSYKSATDAAGGSTHAYGRYQYYDIIALHQSPSGDVCMLFFNRYSRASTAYPALIALIQQPDGTVVEHTLTSNQTLLYGFTSYKYYYQYGLTFDLALDKFVFWSKTDPNQQWSSAGGVVLSIDRTGITDVNSYHLYTNRRALNSGVVQPHLSTSFFSPWSANVVTAGDVFHPFKRFVTWADTTNGGTIFLNDRLILSAETSANSMNNAVYSNASLRRSFQRDDADDWLKEVFTQLGGTIDENH